MVTIKELARRCKLSTFTVSAALSGNPKVAAETRERICRFAEELGYRRNAAASRIRRGCCETLALIIDDLHPGKTQYSEYNEFGVQRDWLCGIAVCARDNGFDLKLLPVSEHNFSGEKLKRYLGAPEADGVIFFGMDYQRELYQTVLDCQVKHIAIKPRCQEFTATPSAEVNSVPAVEAAVRHLLERGHKRIAYSTFRELESPWQRERYSGYENVLREAGYFTPELTLVVPDRATIRKVVEAQLRRRDFTAIVCHNDLSAKVWIDELNYVGFRVPEDFAIIGYDGKSYLPTLSTVDAKGFELGYKSAEALIHALQTDTTPDNQIITAEFLPRETS